MLLCAILAAYAQLEASLQAATRACRVRPGLRPAWLALARAFVRLGAGGAAMVVLNLVPPPPAPGTNESMLHVRAWGWVGRGLQGGVGRCLCMADGVVGFLLHACGLAVAAWWLGSTAGGECECCVLPGSAWHSFDACGLPPVLVRFRGACTTNVLGGGLP